MLRTLSQVVAAIVVAGTLIGANPVLADITVIYETQGQNLFRFQVPDEWEIRPGFEVDPSVLEDDEDPVARIVSLLPQEEKLVMWTALWAPTGVNQLSEAKEYIQDVAPRLLSEVQITFRDDRTINGRKGRIVSGTGIRNDREFDFALVAIQISENRVAFAAFIGEPEAYDRHEKELIGVLNSIKPEGEPQ
ncbi:hypothetical protein NBZ79_13510 [Sneathiella marina]|uniref:DUF1795 domain-containing protein n=1 Tax=Sneathiella marina TaxID=2950108 RepID=A0ABY4W026_9PROT|nr:hypothetical protein [Sneathiella marina]USG60194.1 hypothetical protein NBZ79_13510 [Sneathiella marina]